jgi:hypothetical protein
MQKKFRQIILFSLAGLAIVILSYEFYLYTTANKIEPRKIIYSWNASVNNFEKIYLPSDQDYKLDKKEGALKQEQADINNNSYLETYLLENGRLTISENSKTLWASPPDWKIDNFVISDSNNDGVVDINISVWKPGNFGSSKPFWIKENDMSIKNHFFVFDLADETIKPVWQSSNLGAPNCEFTFADIDSDGKEDLVVIEGEYLKDTTCQGIYVAMWKWNGWGFSNEWRSEKGNFSNLRIENINGKNNIVVRED